MGASQVLLEAWRLEPGPEADSPTTLQAQSKSPPARKTQPEQAGIRRLRSDDIPQLCDLFAATFRPGKTVNRAALAESFSETYLTSPADRLQPASLVDVGADGRLLGFMGIITLHARIGDQTLRGGICGSYMAVDSARARTGLRLARALKVQDLDFIFTDTASQKSTNLLRLMQFESISLQSLEWMKFLKPFGTVGFLLGRRAPVLKPLLQILAPLADIGASRLPFAALPHAELDGIEDSPITEHDFIEIAPELTAHYDLAPDWTGDDLPWIINQARLKTRNGPLHLRQVHDAKGHRLGLYLIYAGAGSAAQVLQILPEPGQDGALVSSLIRFAASTGAVAVKGPAGPHIADGLRRQTGIFYHQVSTNLAYARNPDVLGAFQSHKALIGGLFGETWCRLTTDEFRK